MVQPFEPADLHEDAVRYELACRAAGIGVWELHVSEDRLVYSDIAKSIFGFPLDEPVTREIVHGSLHEDDLEIVLAAARRAMDPKSRADEHYKYRIHRFDTGELRWLRAHGLAQFSGEGDDASALLYAGSVQDIADSELTRLALAASEERLRLAIDAADMAVWDLDLGTEVIAHSPDLNRMLGFPEESQPSLEEFRSRYAAGERERIEAESAAAQARGETSLQTRVRYDVPGKGEVTYILRAALAKTYLEGSGSQRVIGVLFDATEQARAEQRLVTLNKELRHRLKNMANLAGIFARQTWRGDERLETYLGRIRALTMSAELMFGARSETLRLCDLIERSLGPFRPRDLDVLELHGPDAELSDAVFTGVALVIHELATNASKHGALSTPNGRVAVTWNVEGNLLSMEWRESGGPPVKEPNTKGFGYTLLVNGALPPPHSVELDFARKGLVATMTVRLDL
jgi:two-component sensor histidine kinase